MLAHELRRRIAAARVAAEGLAVLRERGDAPWPLVDRLVAELHDLDRLGKRILDDAGLAPDRVDPVAVAAAAAQTVRGARGADVELVAHVGDARVRVDGVLLRQALENLIENAHQHSGGGRVDVEVRRSAGSDGVEILVADRGQQSSSGRAGHGIGLRLVRRLTAGGDVAVWTEPRAEGGKAIGLRIRPERLPDVLALAGAKERIA